MNYMDKKNMTDKEYKEMWSRLGPIQIKMIEKTGLCHHSLGDEFLYKNPYHKPNGVCAALLHVLDWYIWRVTLGFPSWEADDRSIYRVHCPSRKGTVWELCILSKEAE
ncbi:hypothetical protein REC12_03465 [Desulfosporosinus sp. PR]|uniref:hypothetical protein n=1 Tax=Candidatus Desulfosporosinus nitrosoreducens TaxID=3401928 RepID=UPI0027F9A35D|nr:hypothetical protein [Desulfosporosinus sp. PR]MDQ7092638.1 hypothetical protein [Desulfosporosinus sp. PR]